MLSYQYAQLEIEELYKVVSKYKKMKGRKKNSFFGCVKGHIDGFHENINLFPVSLRLRATKAVRLAKESLK